jgi:hypothetical protein
VDIMGLLEILDFHKKMQSEMKEENVSEVEYQLFSWGEIFPPFMGNREHSDAARFILKEYPFKLFSSSTPYEEIPQKLCLTFKSPSGNDYNNSAKEFAAFLSLVTRRRVFPIKLSRVNGLPIESEIYFYSRLPVQERQSLKEIEPQTFYKLLDKLATIERKISNSFILALRLHHSALEIMYADPDFAYLLLITALEAISSIVYADYEPKNELQYLDSRYPEWKKLSIALPPELKITLKEVLMKNEHFISRKFSMFVMENIPDSFWSEREDDAKPDYVYSVIESGGEEKIRRSDKMISQYELIEKQNLRKVLNNIYAVRSKLIHEGRKMPASIVVGLSRVIPIEALGELSVNNETVNQTRIELPIPPLMTFERLVSYSMVEFLRKYST